MEAADRISKYHTIGTTAIAVAPRTVALAQTSAKNVAKLFGLTLSDLKETS